MILYAAVNGYIDDIPVSRVIEFETDFYQFMEANHPDIGTSIAKEKDITPQTEEALKAAILEFKQSKEYTE